MALGKEGQGCGEEEAQELGQAGEGMGAAEDWECGNRGWRAGDGRRVQGHWAGGIVLMVGPPVILPGGTRAGRYLVTICP